MLSHLTKHVYSSLPAWPMLLHFSIVQLDCCVWWKEEMGVRVAFSAGTDAAISKTFIPVFKQKGLSSLLPTCAANGVREPVGTAPEWQCFPDLITKNSRQWRISTLDIISSNCYVVITLIDESTKLFCKPVSWAPCKQNIHLFWRNVSLEQLVKPLISFPS